MKVINAIIYQTPKGKYKAGVWGRPDDHVTGLAECNFRWKALPGQPERGFDSSEEATQFLFGQFESEEDLRAWGSRVGNGSSLSLDAQDRIIDYSAIRRPLWETVVALTALVNRAGVLDTATGWKTASNLLEEIHARREHLTRAEAAGLAYAAHLLVARAAENLFK